MTNEEAIKWLKVEASYIEEDVGSGKEILGAYDMAIEALEQEPCEDCVDKKELLKSIEVALDATNMNDEYSIVLRNGLRLVKSFVDGKRPDYEKVSHLKKQQPCEDCISREAAIFLADGLKDDLPDDDRLSDMVMSHNEGILEYQTKLSLLPSVTPHPRMGEWMHPYKSDIACECSECHIQMPITNYFNYCPSCGSYNGGGRCR